MIHCTFENGGDASLRHVTVNAIVVNDKGQILLAKRASHLTNPGKYGTPGGFLSRDETTEQATLRELTEETGYTGKIVSLFQIIDSPNRPKEDRQNVDFRYIVTITGGKPTENEESSDIRWFSPSEIPSNEEGAFDHLESVRLYLQYQKKPFPLPVINWDRTL